MKLKTLNCIFLLGLVLLGISTALILQDGYRIYIENQGVDISSIPVTEHEWADNWDWLGEERGRAVAIDFSDNIIVVGESELLRGMVIEETGTFILKYSKSGDLLWNITEDYRDSYDVIVDSSDNIYIVERATSNIYVRKFNSSGSLKWHNEWVGGYVSDRKYFLALDSLDNVYLAGANGILIKYNSLTGERVWTESVFPGGVKGLVIDSNNDIYLTLRNAGINYLYKYTENIQLWNITISTTYIDDMKIDSQNNIYTIARNITSDQIILAKYNDVGAMQWNVSWAGEDASKIAISSDDFVFTSGHSAIMKFDSLGTKLWNFTRPWLFIEEEIYDLTLDSTGNIYCVGYCYNETIAKLRNAEDCFIAKYLNTPPEELIPPFQEKNLYALLIGIADYPGTENDLYYCVNDAMSVLLYLRSTCNVPTDNIITLYNDEATTSGINSAFSTIISKIGPSDDFLMFFSGHGYVGGFCDYDSLQYNYNNLDNKIDLINCSHKIVIFDACHSATIMNDFSSRNSYVLTSCESDEGSIETFQLTGGAFTEYLLDSYPLTSDKNLDGIISFEEQYPKIRTLVASYAAEYGVSQHPREYDHIRGPTTVIPSLRNVAINRKNKMFQYSFEMMGSGQIYGCDLTLIDKENIGIIYDVSNSTSSSVGFGNYSGTIEWEQKSKVSSAQLKILVKGERLRVLLIEIELTSATKKSIPTGFFSFLLIMIATVSSIIFKREFKLNTN